MLVILGKPAVFNPDYLLVRLLLLDSLFPSDGRFSRNRRGLNSVRRIIIGIAWLWSKQREKLRQWSQELSV